ncbi:phage antirepressor [Rhodococcus zopfii]|uniref:Phage antirepressor n=1 Tax=Rhodococcus zopfii TaxID=43772 RepID=A0ABU3WMC6_9NOCA|nr:phage antirepressor [Rhodococcus zopfii]MDV2477211.1 phage antirepressor [Rhodococcus zopfii]
MSVPNVTGQLVQIAVPGTTAMIAAAEIDGKPMVSLRHACDALGIAFDAQRVKLQGKSWATITMSVTVAEDGKTRDMLMIDRRTMTMWLATIDENRVGEAAKPTVVAFQAEAADALDAYFHDGGAINPSATEDQLDRITRQAGAQAAVLQALKGIVDPKHLEAKGRIVLARALGEEPELNPADIPLYVSDFLKSKGLASDMIAAKASGFGKRLKGLYISERGEEPKMAHQDLPNGTVRPVCAYTQADRPLFEQVWNRHYAGVTKAVSA